MGRRVGSCTHRRARARTPGHTPARPPARCGGGKRLQQREARSAPATTKPPRAAEVDGEDAGTVSSILPARRRRLPRARRRAGQPQPGRGPGRREEGERCGSVRGSCSAAGRAAGRPNCFAPRCGPSWAGARPLPRHRPKLRAAAVPSSLEPRSPLSVNTPCRGHSHPRRSPAPRGKDARDTANEWRQRGSLGASRGGTRFLGRGSSVGSARRDSPLRLAWREPPGGRVANPRPHAHASGEDAAAGRGSGWSECAERACLRRTLRRLAPPLFPGNKCFKVPDLELDTQVGSVRSQWLSVFLFPASLGQVMC